jgi:hypothetical protein
MSCCCENPLDIGCFCVATGFILDFAAPLSGLTYKLVFGFHMTFIPLSSEPTVTGQPVQFDTSGLNPFYTYIGKLYDENGELVPLFDADGLEYDCFKIQPQTFGGAGKSIPLTLNI